MRKFFHLVASLVASTSIASAQTGSERFEVTVADGEVIVRPLHDSDAVIVAEETELEGMSLDDLGMGLVDQDKAFAVVSEEGLVESVFLAPTPEEKLDIIDSLAPGFSIQKTSWFLGARNVLPTEEDIQGVIQKSISAAIKTLCFYSEPPDHMNITVELAARFSLEGSFSLEVPMPIKGNC